MSQTVGQKGAITQTSQPSNNYSGNKLSSQNVQQANTYTSPTQGDRKQTTSFPSSTRYSGNQNAATNQRTSIGSSASHSSVTSVPSTSSNVLTSQAGSSNRATTYNNHVSFGQKLATNSATISTTSAPYSPSVPPFRSTSATVYTPSASYNQYTQTSYNDQSHRSRSYTQQGQSVSSNNQFQTLSKQYLPSADNTRTARTNELSLGNHGSSTLKSSSSQNIVNHRDGRQQFTYPVDQVSK